MAPQFQFLSPKPFHPSVDALTGVVSFAFDERVSNWTESTSFAVHCVIALKLMFLDETLPLCARHNVAKNHFAVSAYSFDKTHFRNQVQKRIANTLIDDDNQFTILSETFYSQTTTTTNNNNDDDVNTNNNNNNNNNDVTPKNNDALIDDAATQEEEDDEDFSIRFTRFEEKHAALRLRLLHHDNATTSSSSTSTLTKPVVAVVSSLIKGIAEVLRE